MKRVHITEWLLVLACWWSLEIGSTQAQTQTQTAGGNTTDCQLCQEDGQVPQKPWATIQSGEEIHTCQSAYEQGVVSLSHLTCALWKYQGTNVCECAFTTNHEAEADAGGPTTSSPSTSFNYCYLCTDQSNLPFPSLEVVPGKTCADLQLDAFRDDASNCTAWQQTYGRYCGCDNQDTSVSPEGSTSGSIAPCRLCGENSIAETTRMILLTDSTDESSSASSLFSSQPQERYSVNTKNGKACAELEFEANLPDATTTCETSQELYQECCLVDCPLCQNPGEVPQDLSAVFVAGTEVVSCQTALSYGPRRLPPDSCQFWQSRGHSLCKCSSEQPLLSNDCHLCSNGQSLPDPLREGLPNTTCAVLQANAKRDDPELCPIWQKTIGNYCGCDNPALTMTTDNENMTTAITSTMCHLCGEDLTLPNPLQMIDTQYVSNLQDFTACGSLEFQANLEESDCELYQFMFANDCCRLALRPEDVDSGASHLSAAVAAAAAAAVGVIVLPYVGSLL
jgi:hypothetical protein